MNLNNPLVSICIPTYNRPVFLLQALKSCFFQTYKNFEIIITDNSDNNKTQKMVNRIKDKRIRYYKNSNNIGSFNNLIELTKHVKGKYIKFLLDDDLLMKNCLQEMVNILEKNKNVGIVCAPLKIIDEKGQKISPTFYLVKKMNNLYQYKRKSSLLSKKTVMKDFLTYTYPCCVPTGIMYRKECFDKLGTFDEKFKYITDVEICMRIATRYDFFYINKFLSSWRYSPSSETVAILHSKGINPNIFYELTFKYLGDKNVLRIFSNENIEKLKKDSYFFASKRTMLNLAAGIKSKNIRTIINTLKVINKNDPYISNKIKLPFEIISEVIFSFAERLGLVLSKKNF